MMSGYVGVMISDTIAGNLLHVPNEEIKAYCICMGHLGRLGVANPLTEQ